MEIIERRFAGVFEIKLSPIKDERGSFMRTYDSAVFQAAGSQRDWVQENQSRNEEAGIVRGLHFQFPPHAETKLVRCVLGEIFDVFVDLRKGSPTFGQWDGLVLSADNHTMILIPQGFAHGYCTISEKSEVLYKVDNAYFPSSEGGLLWSDKDLGITWPLDKAPALSDKDRGLMSFEDFIARHKGLEV